MSSEAKAAADLGGEARGGGGGFAPVPTDLEDTEGTFEKELLAASKRVEAANARADVATAGQRAPESPGKFDESKEAPEEKKEEESRRHSPSSSPRPRGRAGPCRRPRLLPTRATMS